MLKLFLCLFFSITSTLACTEVGTGFLPPNNLKHPVQFKHSGLSEDLYHEAIDKVLKVYYPIVKKRGAELVMERKWESETVNAGTLRANEGKKWIVNLYGGFARHPFITQDGYILVICHEIGHHIGGAPKKVYPERGPIWASTEGQSDYFATLKCMRKIFRHENNMEIIRTLDIPENIRSECELSFKRDWEVALCLRTSMAGLAVAKVNADSRRVPLPELEILDSNIVEMTRNDHPEPQCRLNTYFQGSICTLPSTKSVSQIDEVRATCHPKLNFTRGLRPSCWFKALP